MPPNQIDRTASGTRPSRRFDAVAIVHGVGWLLMGGALLAGLYVVYLGWFSGLETSRAQQDLGAFWNSQERAADATDDAEVEGLSEIAAGDTAPLIGDPTGDVNGTAQAPATGEPFAALWFERGTERIINDDLLYVVEGVGPDQLRQGPGRYSSTATPGTSGNVAIAGHRTTYGAPFWALDELRHADTIHLLDTHGTEWIYTYVRHAVVDPTDTWVLDDDPLGTGAPTLTLTTCHPRHSAAQRLVVVAELQDRRDGSPVDPTLPATTS